MSDTTERTAPNASAVVNLGSGRTAKIVSAGNQHARAVLDDDIVKCWRGNGNGYLGIGDIISGYELVATDFNGASSSGGAGAPRPGAPPGPPGPGAPPAPTLAASDASFAAPRLGAFATLAPSVAVSMAFL
jgi:hypothetical protein